MRSGDVRPVVSTINRLNCDVAIDRLIDIRTRIMELRNGIVLYARILI